MRYLLGSVALVAVAGAGVAQEPATPQPAASPVVKAEAKKICFERTMIGSNLPRKVCRTAEQLRSERKRGPQVVDPAIVTSVAERGESPN